MPAFAANLSFLFAEVPFPERFARAAAAGFKGVEYLFPYDWPAGELAAQLERHGLTQVLFNLPPGDWAAGERGLACLPGRQAEFVAGLEQAAAYAEALGCRRLHCMAGLRPAGVPAATVREVYVDNLRAAADRLDEAGIEVLIEPINSRLDMPGYWLDDVDCGFELLAAIDRPNVRLQLDLYHAAVMGWAVTAHLPARLGAIGHIQIADLPGRGAPGSGQLPFAEWFALLDRLGYSGWVGCEYRPARLTEAELGWRTALAG